MYIAKYGWPNKKKVGFFVKSPILKTLQRVRIEQPPPQTLFDSWPSHPYLVSFFNKNVNIFSSLDFGRMTVLTDARMILLSSRTLACPPIPQQLLRILAPWWRHPVAGQWFRQRSRGLLNNLKICKWITIRSMGCAMVLATHVLKSYWRWRMVMMMQGCHKPLSKILGLWWLRFCKRQRLGVWLSLPHPPKLKFLNLSPYSDTINFFMHLRNARYD